MKSSFLRPAPGLVGESFYRTHRSNLRAAMTVSFGVAAVLYAGVTQWLRIVTGVRAFDPAFGLSDYMVEIIKAGAIGGIAGALLSWPAGHFWERWHRARRQSRDKA